MYKSTKTTKGNNTIAARINVITPEITPMNAANKTRLKAEMIRIRSFLRSSFMNQFYQTSPETCPVQSR